jgi:DNA-binding response OmpR family regulator
VLIFVTIAGIMTFSESHILFRDKDFEQISKFMTTGEGIRLIAQDHVGKSKFSRYLCMDNATKLKFVKPLNIETLYLDLWKDPKKTHASMLKALSNLLNCKPSIEDIESTLEKQLKVFSKIYIVIDHAGDLNAFEVETLVLLRKINDSFKGKVSYIIVYPLQTIFKPRVMPLMIIFPHQYLLKPLDKEQMRNTILDLARVWDTKFTEKQIQEAIEYSQGFVYKAKEFLSKELSGSNLIIEQEPLSSENLQRILTKNEYAVFNILLCNKEDIVTRQEIAKILSPQSEGTGVSEMAIDQTISRIRSSLEKAHAGFEIITKRGVGFYLK